VTGRTNVATDRFTWRCSEVDRVLHVWFHGELDSHAVRITAAPLQASLVAGGSRTVVVDLGELSFMDSSGLALLLRMMKYVEANGGQFLISRLSQMAKRLIELGGLSAWFDPVDEKPQQTICPVCDGPLSPLARLCGRCGSAL